MTVKRKMCLLVSCLVILTVPVFLFFTRSTELHISNTEQHNSLAAVVCESMNPDRPFFATKSAQNTVHIIKISFGENGAESINYTLSASYPTNEQAEFASSAMHADYNIYVGQKGYNAESFSPYFGVNDNVLKISLFLPINKALEAIPEVFFIDKIGVNGFETKTQLDVAEFYEKNDFDCNVVN